MLRSLVGSEMCIRDRRKTLDDLAADSLAATPQTQIYNMTGQPAVSIPMHVTRDGLPVGVQVAAAFGLSLIHI